MKISLVYLSGAALWLSGAVCAQTPVVTLGTSAADSVPQTTIVPVQQAPVHLV